MRSLGVLEHPSNLFIERGVPEQIRSDDGAFAGALHLLCWTDRFGDSPITDRWLRMAAERTPDLENRLDEARQRRVP